MSNARILKAAKSIGKIKLNDSREYNLAEVLINSDNSDAFKLLNDKELYI